MPRRLTTLFWNRREERLRAGWRLLLHTVLLVGCVFVLGAVATLAAGSIRAEGGGGPVVAGTRSQAVVALLTLAAVSLSLWGAAHLLDRRPVADFGLRFGGRWWADFAFGLVLGTALMAGIFLVGWALGWIDVAGAFQPARSGDSFGGSLLVAFVAFVCVGAYEEMIARGYHLLNVAEGCEGFLGARGALAVACVASSLVFGALHYGNPNATLLSTACLVAAGLLFGWAYVLTGALGLPIGLHISWNFAQGNVFGFPVSGTDAGATLLSTRLTEGSPVWWTGGPFGPEAGASGILALVVAAVAVAAWSRRQRGTARPVLALARYGEDTYASAGKNATR